MTTTRTGPPDGEGRPPGGKPANVEEFSHSTYTTAKHHQGGFPHRIRRAAALRLPPLPPCGCVRDPEVDRHRCGGEISDVMVDAAVAAADHLLERDLLPIFDVETLQAMWRAGHHQLVQQLHVVGGETR